MASNFVQPRLRYNTISEFESRFPPPSGANLTERNVRINLYHAHATKKNTSSQEDIDTLFEWIAPQAKLVSLQVANESRTGKQRLENDGIDLEAFKLPSLLALPNQSNGNVQKMVKRASLVARAAWSIKAAWTRASRGWPPDFAWIR